MCSQQKTWNLEPFGLDSSFSFNPVSNITLYFLWNTHTVQLGKLLLPKKKKKKAFFPVPPSNLSPLPEVSHVETFDTLAEVLCIYNASKYHEHFIHASMTHGESELVSFPTKL